MMIPSLTPKLKPGLPFRPKIAEAVITGKLSTQKEKPQHKYALLDVKARGTSSRHIGRAMGRPYQRTPVVLRGDRSALRSHPAGSVSETELRSIVADIVAWGV